MVIRRYMERPRSRTRSFSALPDRGLRRCSELPSGKGLPFRLQVLCAAGLDRDEDAVPAASCRCSWAHFLLNITGPTARGTLDLSRGVQSVTCCVEPLGKQSFDLQAQFIRDRLLEVGRRGHQRIADRLPADALLVGDLGDGTAPYAESVNDPCPPFGGIFWDV